MFFVSRVTYFSENAVSEQRRVFVKLVLGLDLKNCEKSEQFLKSHFSNLKSIVLVLGFGGVVVVFPKYKRSYFF